MIFIYEEILIIITGKSTLFFPKNQEFVRVVMIAFWKQKPVS